MVSENGRAQIHGDGVVELTRVQPIEAEVIVARLRASGIPATLGADSVYPSLTFADGVPVFVPAEDAPRAEALLREDDQLQSG
jgi:Putative prokaryotic signal transducing protein